MGFSKPAVSPLPLVSSYLTFSPLPWTYHGGLVSEALSLGSPPLGITQVGAQAVLGRQLQTATPWLTERHGYELTWVSEAGGVASADGELLPHLFTLTLDVPRRSGL